MKAHCLDQLSCRELAASEALFGSTSRGDTDSLSDRDYLIADKDGQRLKNRHTALKASGLSIAGYTYRRLGALSQNGDLFIQHLKQDAIIIRDIESTLSSILRDFRPRTSYSEEIILNRSLAALCEFPPRTPRGLLWAADVAFVAFRNYAILTLADRGIYEFSFEGLVDKLIDLGDIVAHHRSTAHILRQFKYQYRDDPTNGLADARELEGILQVLPSRHFPRRIFPLDAECIMAVAPLKQTNASAYCYSRMIERWLIAVASVHPSILAIEAFTRIEKYVRDPRLYAYNISVETRDIVQKIHQELIGSRQYMSARDQKLSRHPR